MYDSIAVEFNYGGAAMAGLHEAFPLLGLLPYNLVDTAVDADIRANAVLQFIMAIHTAWNACQLRLVLVIFSAPELVPQIQ